MSNMQRPCTQCGELVHRNSKSCKACGAASPWAEHGDDDDLPVAYVVTERFSAMIGTSLRTFEEGEEIADLSLAERLVHDGDPVRRRTKDDRTLVCPHCHKTFLAQNAAAPPQFSPEVQEKIRRLGISA